MGASKASLAPILAARHDGLRGGQALDVQAFIDNWWGKPGGAEKSNFAPFISDLCELLGVDRPGQSEKGRIGAYEYEASVPKGSFRSLDGTGAVDLYRRGHFIMEAKQSYLKPQQTPFDLGDDNGPRAPSGARYDKLMRDARLQAENYAKNLPAAEPVAPFLIVCDVGRAFEIYVDAAGNGRGYQFFPDKLSYRIELTALADEREIANTGHSALDLLRAIWTDPRSIDPRFQSADVTRVVARNLASVSKYLEDGIKARGLTAFERSLEIEEASLFLMRILFCMFAEDIGLLPEDRFKDFLKRAESNDALFANGLADLWSKMNSADAGARFAHALEADVRHFNGGLFESNRTYPLGGFVIHDLYEAARQNWRKVEPAIFGTLLEQALSAEERSKLGAHYTPRAYVELLVRATIMDVLNAEWEAIEERIGEMLLPPSPSGEGPGVGDIARDSAKSRAPTPAGRPSGLSGGQSGSPARSPKGEGDQVALNLAAAFHTRLAAVRVLDPACGTGNFLYVAMELMQALEARVIERIETLGGTAKPRIGPQQFHGLEKNPRAAKIAELVLWIGWLRNRLRDDPESIPDPVLERSANINRGQHGGYDAVLAQTETGEPDFANPRTPVWPPAEFIVGNPPFIGGKDLRARLGSDYAEALWKANPLVPKSADFVMQWWDRAAHILTASGSSLLRFGFVTTNSITQEFSRRVIANYLSSPSSDGEGDQPQAGGGVAGANASEVNPSPSKAGPPPPAARGEDFLSLILAIPDHPWTKATRDAAAVRIAMTVARRGAHEGELAEVTSEAKLDSDEPEIVLASVEGRINANLTTGADVSAAEKLLSNIGICHDGVKLHGQGFSVTRDQAQQFGLQTREDLKRFVRPYRNGKDINGRTPREVEGKLVLDFYGQTEKRVREKFPEAYQHLLNTVREARRKQVEKSPTADALAYFEYWWVFGKPRPELRVAQANISRYIGTSDTAKHRVFQFINHDVVCDDKVVIVASDTAYILGVLQSAIHVRWALAAGGWLGVGNDSVYVKSKVFDPFPFPDATDEQRSIIADLAEELDETRKLAIAETDRLTMTELYNLREKLRAQASGGDPMSEKDERRAVKARAGIVDRLHQQLDAAVADAYGWGEEWPKDGTAGTLGPSEIVARLVALNAARAAEEANGHIRWLRPHYQIPRFAPKD
ncbi:class I SAM-dependent DNA methyltransferase [Novosphingopyxis sp.]|uniref:class I SAM-dependent DNA methyltransferase n=1 Tax=Novosphingopyxis sp. TaxID=2709690 RepID=UPI003B5B5F57